RGISLFLGCMICIAQESNDVASEAGQLVRQARRSKSEFFYLRVGLVKYLPTRKAEVANVVRALQQKSNPDPERRLLLLRALPLIAGWEDKSLLLESLKGAGVDEFGIIDQGLDQVCVSIEGWKRREAGREEIVNSWTGWNDRYGKMSYEEYIRSY